MPRLSRVTPRSRMAASLGSVSVPGSHSNVISSADVHGVDGGQPLHQAAQLPHRQERRRAAAEVDEVERPPVDRRIGVVELPLARHHVEIFFDFLRVLVGVDAEIAEVAALPAERDVQVQAERHRRRPASSAPAAHRARPRRRSRRRTADSWRRNSCRPPSRRHRASPMSHIPCRQPHTV